MAVGGCNDQMILNHIFVIQIIQDGHWRLWASQPFSPQSSLVTRFIQPTGDHVCHQIYHRLCFNVIIMFIMVLILLIIMMMKLMITHRRPSVVMSTEVSDSLRWGDTRHSKSIKITTIVIWSKMPKIILGKARWRCRRVCVIFQAGCANFLLLCGQSMLQTDAIANWALALVQEFVY